MIFNYSLSTGKLHRLKAYITKAFQWIFLCSLQKPMKINTFYPMTTMLFSSLWNFLYHFISHNSHKLFSFYKISPTVYWVKVTQFIVIPIIFNTDLTDTIVNSICHFAAFNILKTRKWQMHLAFYGIFRLPKCFFYFMTWVYEFVFYFI